MFFFSASQNHFGIANFWKDPEIKDDYFRVVKFLPKLNNELAHESASQYKKNFLKLKKVFACGSDGDQIIEPW